jgi:hypothetical protein
VEFRGKLVLGIAAVMLSGSFAEAQSDDTAQIAVLVVDSVDVGRSLLRRAEADTSELFRDANIEIDWVNCSGSGENDICQRIPGPREFVLHIVPDGRTQNDLVFGESFLGEDGNGKYSDVFFDRVRDTGRESEAGVAQLLGAVAAHELGHLLLGTRAHSSSGIMEPRWRRESLHQISMGRLLFTREQSLKMRRRISGDGLSLSAVRVTNRGAFDRWY